jgi:hypothetical protein
MDMWSQMDLGELLELPGSDGSAAQREGRADTKALQDPCGGSML